MRIKQPEFLELLNTFIGEYMPLTAGLSDNTVRLYKATFRPCFAKPNIHLIP